MANLISNGESANSVRTKLNNAINKIEVLENDISSIVTTGAKIAIGTYTGNGVDNRTVTLPFAPKVIFVQNNETGSQVSFSFTLANTTNKGQGIKGSANGNSSYAGGGQCGTISGTTFTTSPKVGNYGTNGTNVDGVIYTYVIIG